MGKEKDICDVTYGFVDVAVVEAAMVAKHAAAAAFLSSTFRGK
jgi:hypothetical protein